MGGLVLLEEIDDGVIAAGKGPQVGPPVRVGQYSHVKHQIGIVGQAVLEPERFQLQGQGRAAIVSLLAWVFI